MEYRRIIRTLAAGLAVGVAGCGGGDTRTPQPPPGAERSAATRALESGANLAQDLAPVGQISMYLSGFHPMKEDPAHQMEAHHYCNQVNEDFAQCVLFDGNTGRAKLNGIEYIVSEKLFESLPEEERQYWHPHNYEILSGMLVAPGVPDAAEHEVMRRKMNSYGKTWHVWNTGTAEAPGDALPVGPAQLAWSFNRDGEAAPGLVENRDRRQGIDSGAKRAQREDLVKLARPQSGVDTIRGAFPQGRDVPGVQPKGEMPPRE